ncbi:hypothetical protein FQN49_004537 [Arthroderma sp. PD_2]|nr:hypothetical protein FQN49_004537 [Arthroderma sp. PD_2]
MSIGRLQAALAAATNEVTVAAANINFDFTLVKCEAPKEYQVLGRQLSENRKERAETGSAHITARKLGALLDGICAPTPMLIKSYGVRASEIAEVARDSSPEPNDSIFSAHTGIDGTSIWAAATSSPTALHVHLLACMIARIWGAQEAVPIWVELVKQRREDIASRYKDGEALHYSTLTAAAQSEIPRSSLREWDASVRSWLRTADRTNTKKQQQLMLIIANVNVPINKDMRVLSSVITAWKSALDTMEKLVSGMPQAINSGPALLALSSWHLYPDLVVVCQGPKEIRFYDSAVSPGGVLTIGLANSGDEGCGGVYWSLSLAHMHFYGNPVRAEACLNDKSSKISFNQLTQAMFGCLLGSWSLNVRQIPTAAKFFISFREAIERGSQNGSESEAVNARAVNFLKDSSHWWNIMAKAAAAYLDEEGEGQDAARRLTMLGLRRSSSFLPENSRHPFFGFCDLARILSCLKGSEERVTYLRNVTSAAGAHHDPNPIFIRYFDGEPGIGALGNFATAVPLQYPLYKRRRDSDVTIMTHLHYRWLSNSGKPQPENTYRERFSPLGDTFAPVLRPDADSSRFLYAQLGSWQEYSFVYGSPKVAGIYQSSSSRANQFQSPTLRDLIWLLDQDMFSIAALLRMSERLDPLADVSKTMMSITMASMIYKVMPNASVSIKVLDKPIYKPKWAEGSLLFPKFSYTPKRSMEPDRATALSCIAYMESGLDIDPSLLTDVLALAYEDSLYLAMQLTCDPLEQCAPYELKRVLGNVGRPGITMLVPPSNPIVQQHDPASWNIINNNPFNGLPEDHFKQTSLHLSFTEYYVPLVQTANHAQDSEVFFLESVVSVHDSGRWIGDVDILRALGDTRVNKMFLLQCTNSHPPDYSTDMISAEGWDDILDPPNKTFVVRASCNWAARLAVTAILSQSLPKDGTGCDITICPKDVCWICNDTSPGNSEVGAFSLNSHTPRMTRAFIF